MKIAALPKVVMIILLGACGSIFAQPHATLDLLRRNDIAALEASLAEVQRRFENQELTDYELRNAFRPFYTLDPASEGNLHSWAETSPKSYVAHLALGIYYKRLGNEARGENFIAETPQKKLDEMRRYYQLAEPELRRSMALTAKPYLSIFHLLDIAGHLGDRRSLDELIARANRALPGNSLARNRYAGYLLPRWGGSYSELDRFIEQTAKQGSPATVVQQLKAIKFDDMGLVLAERGAQGEANGIFEKALHLGQEVGGSFSEDFLVTSRYYFCPGAAPHPYCR